MCVHNSYKLHFSNWFKYIYNINMSINKQDYELTQTSCKKFVIFYDVLKNCKPKDLNKKNFRVKMEF